MGTARRVRASRGHRFPITVRPTNVDIAVAREIARDTAPAPEEVARVLTWGADEKVLLVLAAAGWLASRGHGEGLRRAGNHAVLVAVAAALLPHGMKRLFDQTRPDRRTVLGHVHGISFSGSLALTSKSAGRARWFAWRPADNDLGRSSRQIAAADTEGARQIAFMHAAFGRDWRDPGFAVCDTLETAGTHVLGDVVFRSAPVAVEVGKRAKA
jgi:hypothetical protein